MAQKLKFKGGDKAQVRAAFYHNFPDGKIVNLTKRFKLSGYPIWLCCDENGNCQDIYEANLKQINTKQMTQTMTQAVLDTANKLLKAQNTVTTLEIKTQVIVDFPNFFWTQDFVSKTMDTFHNQGLFTFTDNGVYRTYSSTNTKVATPVQNGRRSAVKSNTKASAISRKKAYELITNNKGHFFTATFVKKDNIERTINCQYMTGKQDSLGLGYVKVKETGKLKTGVNPVRQINLQTLTSLKIGGNLYKIRK